MKPIKLIFIAFGILLFGCKESDSQKKVGTVEKSVNETSDTIQKEEEKRNDNNKLAEDKAAGISHAIDLFKQKNAEKISDIISYPLHREHPIPEIKNKQEFIKRFSEVFDNVIIEKIANSKMEQWSEMGWRGIMLDDGLVWMGNSDGIITAVNYQSDYEKKLINDLIAAQKGKLYPTLKTFKSPTYKIKTKNYLIRIDELTNNKYRYASWKITETESSKPDIIIENGELKSEGSGGNHVITFVKENYTYKIYRNIIGEKNSPDINLEIEKDGKIILTEDGTLNK